MVIIPESMFLSAARLCKFMNEKEIKNEEANCCEEIYCNPMIDEISLVYKELFMTDELLELEREVKRKYPEFDPDHVMTPEEEERFWSEILESLD